MAWTGTAGIGRRIADCAGSFVMPVLQYAQPDQQAGPSGLSGLVRKLSRGRNVWALADQALISGTNFVTTILVARGLGDERQFGYFSNVYSGLLFANLLQTALITQPHNVLGTSRFGDDRAGYVRYTTTTAYAQLLLAVIAAAAALLFVPVAHKLEWHTERLLLALVPSIAAWQLQEFVRRVLYSESRTGGAFINDLISYGGQTVGIGILWWLGRLTAVNAMYVLAVTSAAAAAVGAVQLRHSLGGRFDLHAWIENWNFGKWLVGSELLTWLSSVQMYMYIAAAVVGAAASGELKAAQTLFGPARVIAFFLATVLPIQFAQALGAGGIRAMDRQLKSITMKLLPVMAAYCLLVAVFAGPLLALFGKGFAASRGVLELYSAVAFLTYVQMVAAAALTAKRETRFIFVGSVWGAVIAVAFGAMLIKLLGVYGALAGMLLTGGTVCTLYWKAYRTTVAESDAQEEQPDGTAEVIEADKPAAEVVV